MTNRSKLKVNPCQSVTKRRRRDTTRLAEKNMKEGESYIILQTLNDAYMYIWNLFLVHS